MTNIILKKCVPNIVYYNDDHSKSPVCTTELSEINGAAWTLPSTRQALTREIERGEDKIVFHIDVKLTSIYLMFNHYTFANYS